MGSQPATPAVCSFLKEGVVLWSPPFAPHGSTSLLLFRLQFLQPSNGCPFLYMSVKEEGTLTYELKVNETALIPEVGLEMIARHCCCSVTKSCLTLCNPTDCSKPGFPILHYLPKFAHIHVH